MFALNWLLCRLILPMEWSRFWLFFCLKEEEICRLLEVNKRLNEQVQQKDIRISEIEDVLEVNETGKKERRTGSVCVELSGLSKTNAENVLSRETVLDISDTQC